MTTNMAGIQASFLDNSDNSFWVAEAEVNGKSKVAGVVVVVGKRRGDERGDGWNGGPFGEVDEIGQDKREFRRGTPFDCIV